VTGRDISPKAVSLARDLAACKGVKCAFAVADLLNILPIFHEIFSLALEWEVLHHIMPKDRKTYMSNVHRLLKTGGLYLSVCFSERDPAFGGKGKSRITPLGTELYFSSEEELLKLFHAQFSIIELGTIEIPGKYEPHMAVAAWLQKT
jgi:SAM-dependent methyltransferase